MSGWKVTSIRLITIFKCYLSGAGYLIQTHRKILRVSYRLNKREWGQTTLPKMKLLFSKKGQNKTNWLQFLLILNVSALSATVVQGQSSSPVNRIIENLFQDSPAIGTFTRTPETDIDFTVIDEQYGEFDINDVRKVLVDMRVDNRPPIVAPIVRIPLAARDAPQDVVRLLLDAGVFGIMFPDIETQEQATAAIGSMRFPQPVDAADQVPPGLRGSGSGSAPGYWGTNEEEYRTQADVWPLDPAGKLVAMIQIESLTGIRALNEILEVPGIGVIFLGPTDLASSTGAEGPNAPTVEALVQEVLQVCLARNIPCGYPIVANSHQEAERETARRLAEGFKVLAVMTRAQ